MSKERVQTKCFERWNGQVVWMYGPRSGTKTELHRCVVKYYDHERESCHLKHGDIVVGMHSDDILSLFEIKVLASGGLLEKGTPGKWNQVQAPDFYSKWNQVFHYVIMFPDEPVVYAPIERNVNFPDVPVPHPDDPITSPDYMSMPTFDLFEIAGKLGAHIRYANELNVDTTNSQKSMSEFEAEIARRSLQKDFENWCTLGRL